MQCIAHAANVDKFVLCRIRKCLFNINDAATEKMLSPSTYKAGASTVLTSEEEAMIVELLVIAGKRGFAVGKDTLECLMTYTASDGQLFGNAKRPN